MANKTLIEWTDFNWNFLRGCSRVSEGCRNCYAEGIAARFSGEGQPYEGLAKFVDHKPRWTGEVKFIEKALYEPLKWRKPRKVFVNSMSDLFHEKVKDEWLDKAFAVMALTPQHTYQVLTKRPDRMLEYLSDKTVASRWQDAAVEIANSPCAGLGIDELEGDPLPNVWLGVSVEDQKTADERIRLLLTTPATKRFLSIEPLLGPIDLSNIKSQIGPNSFITQNAFDKVDSLNKGYPWPGIDWVIVGGESGPNARPMHPDWVRSIRDQCQGGGVPFFFKQGSKANWPNFKDFEKFPAEFQIRQFPEGQNNGNR